MRLFQAALDTPLDSPFSAALSVHGLHFTVCAPSNIPGFCRDIPPIKQPKSLRKKCLGSILVPYSASSWCCWYSCRGVPSDGLRRYGLSIFKTQERNQRPKCCKPERHGQRSNEDKWLKVALRGCKTSFGPTDWELPKSHLRRCKQGLRPCNPMLRQCNKRFVPTAPKTFCALSKALWATSADLTSVPGGLVCNPNAFKTRLKCTCHETALSVTRQTCTWNYPELGPFGGPSY